MHCTSVHASCVRVVKRKHFRNYRTMNIIFFFIYLFGRYVMIAHHSSYARIYRQHWIAVMILFCWLFAYGMQLPTFFKVWGSF